MQRSIYCWWITISLITISVAAGAQTGNARLVPRPAIIKQGRQAVSLQNGFSITTNDTALKKLIPVLREELYRLTGLKPASGKGSGVAIHLAVTPGMGAETYQVRINDDVEVRGGAYQAVAEGTVTLLQLINEQNGLPEAEIRDSAAFAYRALMIDVARSWHSVETLKKIISLCRWYKIKYLQLHLTDDQSFTLPSATYPSLPTKNRHYTAADLKTLNEYAGDRGVTIIPEIDVPSHSSSLIAAMPGLFGIRNWKENSYTVNMGSEKTYQALNVIIGEAARLFPQSPYIHIGGDEVFAGGMEKDSSIQHFMRRHSLHSLTELYQYFITRMCGYVKGYGKQPVIWSGFQKNNKVKIPRDVLVMEYETANYDPQELADDGYTIINASFNPLYVVNNRRWDPAYIYSHWNAFNWKAETDFPGDYEGNDIHPHGNVAGASMSAWEQAEDKEIPSLRLRLGAMSERLWSAQKRGEAAFMQDLHNTDKKFGRLLTPVQWQETGRTYPGSDDSNFDEHTWFDSAVTVTLSSAIARTTIRYTTDGSFPGSSATRYTAPLTFNKNTRLRIQAYNSDGRPTGFSLNRNYRLKPVRMEILGIRHRKDMRPNSWEAAKFEDSVTIRLSSKIAGHIRYTLNGAPLSQAVAYTAPLKLYESGSFKAQLYDAGNRPLGLPSEASFIKIKKESSLTTGMAVSASTDRVDPRPARLIVDGELTKDDYWSDKAGGWVTIDLGKAQTIDRLKVYPYWDNYRYYQYVIDISPDGKAWQQVVDFSKNTEKSTAQGYVHIISPVKTRYIKITMLYNSANAMMHLVELNAFGPSLPGQTRASNNLTATITALIERWLPGRSSGFIIEEDNAGPGTDHFTLQSYAGKIKITGNSPLAVASGFNYYLKHYCHLDISIQGNDITPPEVFPPVKEKVVRQTPFAIRYFLNYCTFGYTMAWWNWQRWEKLIDWMAMNGINMPLAITGQEAVWQQLLKELNFSDKEISDFIAGPAFLPWGWMGNIDGMAGPLPANWTREHVMLQKKILERERSFGMKPVLQAFTGHMPKSTRTRYPGVKIIQTTDWAGMPGTYVLDPQDTLFEKIGRRFIEIQTQLYGTDHLYDADCFNEVNPPSSDTAFIGKIAGSVFKSMTAADPQATWIMQGWFLFWQKDFWKKPQAEALLGAVPPGKLILLDLYGEKYPVWKETSSFYGKPWVWNIICNLGQKVNLSGDLAGIYRNFKEATTSPAKGDIKGIGMMMEGFGYNPVVQEFITDLVWSPEVKNLSTWITGYATRRYGGYNEHAATAWKALLQSVYSYTISEESLICYTPGALTPPVSGKNPYGAEYNTGGLFKAAGEMLLAAEQLKNNENYQFDLVHIMREALSLNANRLFTAAKQAADSGNIALFKEKSAAFIHLLGDMDTLLAANKHFLLGKWISDAKSWGHTGEEQRYYEWNARNIVTLWEPFPDSHLRDYASKQWNGLVGDFYLYRWKKYFSALLSSLETGQPLNRKKFSREISQWEYEWTRKDNKYPDKPSGDAVAIAKRLYHKYVK